MLMTPVKLAGEQLMMGAGCLAHLATLKGARAMIVTGGSSMDRAGVIARAEGYLHHNVLAGYVHLHWGRTPEVATRFVRACRDLS